VLTVPILQKVKPVSLYLELLGRKALAASLNPWKDYVLILKSNAPTVTNNGLQSYASTTPETDTSPDE